MTAQWHVDPTRGWLARADTRELASVQRIDPYLVWAEATGYADLGGIPDPPDRFAVAIELTKNGGMTAKDLAKHIEENQWGSWIWMSSLYRDPPKALEDARFCTAQVTREFFKQLDSTLQGKIERFTLGLPVITGGDRRREPVNTAAPSSSLRSCAIPQDSAWPAGGYGNAVVGICDDGIAFAHQRFHTDASATATRVQCVWNQDDSSNPDAGLGYGRELLKSQIDTLMQVRPSGRRLTEDEIYRQLRYTCVDRRWAHGTAVMDLACGEHPVHHAEPNPSAHIIGVQFRLPGRTIRDTSGLWLDVQALDAIRYVVARAEAIAGPKCPVFVNLSYGYIAGPHDGSSMLEAAVDELMTANACTVVIPAGNSNLDRCHARHDIPPRNEKRVTWRVLPDTRTPSFMEIWLSSDVGDPIVELEIVPPQGGESSSWIRKGNVATWMVDGDVVCTAVHRGLGAKGDGHMILIALAPTFSLDPQRRAAPSGHWAIGLRNAGTAGVHARAWIQRNDTLDGFPIRGRQSRFDDPAYERFNAYGQEKDEDSGSSSWIRRSGTLNSIATGRHSVVIGGFRERDDTIAKYSATGPGRVQRDAEPRTGPNGCCISEYSATCIGVLAAGTRTGSAMPLSGTSAAAPQMVRRLAHRVMQQSGGFARSLCEQEDVIAQMVAASFIKPELRPTALPGEQMRQSGAASTGAGRIMPEPDKLRAGDVKRS